MRDHAHNLQLAVLRTQSAPAEARFKQTLNRLSWSTFLMAVSSPVSISFAWKTTPKEPLPTALRLVYEISLFSPVWPSQAGTV